MLVDSRYEGEVIHLIIAIVVEPSIEEANNSLLTGEIKDAAPK